MIIEHLVTFDMNLSMLVDVIERYRLEGEIEELVEIVRCLDILGAERRLSEYEGALWIKLRGSTQNESEWERVCGDRLPVSFFEHTKTLRYVR
jgi:hypothetical protein